VATDLPHDPDCLLCAAERITPWHHEDDRCWIADCFQCATPMVVWKQHGIDPSDDDRDHMLGELARVAEERFGPSHGGFRFDHDMRTIPDHFHCHGRPKGAFFGPGGGPKPLPGS
jgi:hypothetical protein